VAAKHVVACGGLLSLAEISRLPDILRVYPLQAEQKVADFFPVRNHQKSATAIFSSWLRDTVACKIGFALWHRKEMWAQTTSTIFGTDTVWQLPHPISLEQNWGALTSFIADINNPLLHGWYSWVKKVWRRWYHTVDLEMYQVLPNSESLLQNSREEGQTFLASIPSLMCKIAIISVRKN
jgi:hypothetical protein